MAENEIKDFGLYSYIQNISEPLGLTCKKIIDGDKTVYLLRPSADSALGYVIDGDLELAEKRLKDAEAALKQFDGHIPKNSFTYGELSIRAVRKMIESPPTWDHLEATFNRIFYTMVAENNPTYFEAAPKEIQALIKETKKE